MSFPSTSSPSPTISPQPPGSYAMVDSTDMARHTRPRLTPSTDPATVLKQEPIRIAITKHDLRDEGDMTYKREGGVGVHKTSSKTKRSKTRSKKIMSEDRSVLFDLPCNVGNSCYIDSALCALLFRGNNFIDGMVQIGGGKALDHTEIIYGDTSSEDVAMRKKIRTRLVKLAVVIRSIQKGTDTATNIVREIRGLLSMCNFRSFRGHAQEDSGELIMTLCAVLGVSEDMSTTATVIYGCNDLLTDANPVCVVTSNRMERSGFVWSIPMEIAKKARSTKELLQYDTDVVLQDGFTHCGKRYHRLLTHRKFIPGGCFAIVLNRNDHIKGIKNTDEVPLDKSFEYLGRYYFLISVVIHVGGTNGGHYTSILSTSRGRYYGYDDGARPLLTDLGTDWTSILDQYGIQRMVTVAIYGS